MTMRFEKRHGWPDVLVVVGTVIPAQDYNYLRQHGTGQIFGLGTVIPDAAKHLIADLEVKL